MPGKDPSEKDERDRKGRGKGEGGGRGEEYPLPRSVRCPFCGRTETEIQSPFGGVMSVAQYYCRRCRTVFEWIKWSKKRDDDD